MAQDVSGRGQITQTGAQTFDAPETMIKSVIAGKEIYSKFRGNHLKRIGLYAEIDGLIAGNPPYNTDELRAAGLQHISNFNDLSARAIVERQALAYWNLLHNSQYLTRFVLRNTKDPDAPHYSDLMAQHWDFAVKNHWKSFLINLASLQWQLVKFGVSPAFFHDERDPRWRMVELNRFFVPDQAQADLDMLTTMLVETDFTVQYLWNVYKEFRDKEKKETPDPDRKDPNASYTPWNAYELGMLLLRLGNSNIKEGASIDQLEMDRRIFSGDIAFDKMFNDSVRIISLFQKEYGGDISHYMFHRDHDAGNFLFFQGSQYQDMAEAVVIFTMNPGESTIHSNRGVGHKIFSLAQAKTMLDCSVVDMAKWSSTPIIKSPSLNTRDADQIRFYPGVPTNIGSADFVQNNLGANVQNVVGAAEYMANLIQFNTTYSGSDSSAPDPDQGSLAPSEARIRAFREFGVLKNQIMHFYQTADCLIQNMTAKMLRSKEGYPGYEIAECWKDRCIEDGVPKEVFDLNGDEKDKWKMPKHIEVYATRAAGAGSQVALLIGLQELQAIAPTFGPREEDFYKRQYVAATVGPEYIDSYMQSRDDVDERAGGASLAGLENAIIQDGKSPIFSPDNEHRSHLVTHMALAQQIVQGIQEQRIDVVQADRMFTVLVPHMGEHMQPLSQSMFAKNFYLRMKPLVDQLNKYAALNRKNAERALQSRADKQEQDRENQDRVMNELELKNFQAEQEERRSDMKLAAQNARQERAGAAKESALERKVVTDERLKTVSTISEIRNQNARTTADILNKQKQAQKPPSKANGASESK